MFEVSWSGGYPSLCCGEWTIIKNGVDVSDKIPKAYRHDSMNTWGLYQRWCINMGDWEEYEETYEDGLEEKEWITCNRNWIKEFCDNEEEMIELYWAISQEDWRGGSCGGCI